MLLEKICPRCAGSQTVFDDKYGHGTLCIRCGYAGETRPGEHIPEREQCPGSGIPPRRRDYGTSKRSQAEHCEKCGEIRWTTDDGMVSPHRVYNKHTSKKPKKAKGSRGKYG